LSQLSEFVLRCIEMDGVEEQFTNKIAIKELGCHP
jgi:hypothetical protein